MKNLEHFKFSLLFTLVGFALALFVGGPQALFIVAVLSVMEVSLSFDNAVVNATVLKDMDAKWQQRFLTWGILIAVFGMRIIFPLLVVCVAGGISPLEALDIAINDHEQYAAYMHAEHVPLMGFGAGFLMLVGLHFFFDDEKDSYWIPAIEKKLASYAGSAFLPLGITFILMFVLATFGLEGHEFKQFLVAGVLGMLSHEAIGLLAAWMEEREEEREKAAASATGAVAKSGFAMFMYLEVLDASFSFDGVIGAFAITTDIFIIAIGLGIGALFVRSMTIMLVKKGTLTEYEYLEHGAFYAIVALAVIMMLKSFYEVPELVTGFIGVSFIGLAFYHSLEAKKAEEALVAASENGTAELKGELLDAEPVEDEEITKSNEADEQAKYEEDLMESIRKANPDATEEEIQVLFNTAMNEQ